MSAPDEKVNRFSGDARPKVYGMCTHCGAVEVELNTVTGIRDLSELGESPTYSTGFGCEVCS